MKKYTIKYHWAVIIALPLIICQWYFKLEWLKLEAETALFANAYILSAFYLLAYLLIYKKKKIGYLLIWAIFIVLNYIDYKWLGNSPKPLMLCADLWVNLILSGFGIYDLYIKSTHFDEGKSL